MMPSPGHPHRQRSGGVTRSSERQRPPTRAAVVYDRRRTSKACSVCRHRKTRCDGQRPECGFCLSTGAVCDYSEALSTRLDESSLEIIQRLEKLERQIDQRFDKLQQQQQEQQYVLETSPKGPAPIDVQMRSTDFLDSPLTITGRQDPTPANTTSALASGPPSCEAIYTASHFTLESILRWPVLSENSPAVEELVRTSTMQLLGQVSIVDDSSPDDELTLCLDSVNLERLLEAFLEHNFIKNPVLDTDELRTEVYNVATNGLRWNGGSCLVLLICAIGSISNPLSTSRFDAGPNHLREADAYFQASQRRLGMLRHQNSLIALQCSFLTGVYLMSTLQITAAWKAFAQASTQFLSYYLSLGKFGKDNQDLHMPASPYDQKSSASTASRNLQVVEESLYWSCLKSELELRIELSLPGSGLNERDYPNVFPCPPDSLSNIDEHWHKASRGGSVHDSSSTPSDHRCIQLGWFFYLAEIALRHIANRAVQTNHEILQRCLLGPDGHPDLKGLNVQDIWEVTREFDQQLQEWLTSLPQEMQFEMPSMRPTNSILKFILRGHMIDIIESIRFPVIRALVDSTWASLPSPPDMYLELCKEMLNNCVYRIEANLEGFYHRHQGTWLTIRSCTRSALMLLGVSKWSTKAARQMRAKSGLSHEEDRILGLVDYLMPHGWQRAVLQVLEMTKAWAGESLDVARLRDVIATLLSDVIRDAGP